MEKTNRSTTITFAKIDNSKLKNCIIINGKIPKNSTITNSLIFEEKIFEFSKFDS